MTAPSPARPGASSRRLSRFEEQRIARTLLVVTFAFAFIVQNEFFEFSNSMNGDIDYHRGVAMTVVGGMWQGQGPIHGIVSYFGGLYPMILGWTADVLGVSFDAVLSVVSWPFAIALPVAFFALGRTLWPRRTLEPALLVFVGTVGSSFATNPHASWVFSALPSGANEWPVFPRDVALVAIVFALAAACGGLNRRHMVIAGVLGAFAIATQAQMGIYGVLAVAAVVAARRTEKGMRATQWKAAVAVGVIAVVGSAWWWVPRAGAGFESGHLLLASYPGLERPDGSVLGLLNAFGLTGLLAGVGLFVALRSEHDLERIFGVWFAILLPLVIFGGFLSDLGVLTERRAWFFAGIPLVVCAAIGLASLLRWSPFVPTLLVVAVALIVPSTIESLQTRDVVEQSWTAPNPASAYGSSQWSAAFGQLRDQVSDTAGSVVLAPDGDALFMWQNTGAQPFSLWLSGSTKLGFEPANLTSWSYLARVHLQDQAFRAGLAGLCRLTRQVGAPSILLRHRGSLLGTHDRRPASRWRVDPRDRNQASIRRKVQAHTTYRDLNSTEALALTRGAEVPIGWSSAGVRQLDVTLLRLPRPDSLVLRTPDGATITPLAGRRSTLQFQVNGIPAGTRLVAQHSVGLVRVIGFEPSPITLPAGSGVVNLLASKVCPS